MIAAEDARREALAFPGGFSDGVERQVGMLDSMAEEIREAEPDLEGHRLRLENSPDLLHYLARQRDARREKIREQEEAMRRWDEQQKAREREDGDDSDPGHREG